MKALLLVALLAGCKSEMPPVSPGTGGAVCSFTASGMMSNLATTSLASNEITDTITGVSANGVTNVKWTSSFVVDGGCVGTNELILNVPADASAGDSEVCADQQGLTWLENQCNGTRAWLCTGGSLHVDAVSDSTLDVSFAAIDLMPGGFPGTNQAAGNISLTGSCSAIRVLR